MTPRPQEHYAWKGDDATERTKRERAERWYELGPCEDCGRPGHDRHHVDGDVGNNSPENIAILCRRCHMKRDGRLALLKDMARENAERNVKDPEPCKNCGQLYKPLRKGRCHNCDMYLRRRGFERPEKFW